MMVSAEKRQQEITAFIQSTYGLTLEAASAPRVITYPTPKIYLDGVTLKSADAHNILHAPTLIVDIGWGGLVQSSANAISLNQPDIYLTNEELGNLYAYFTTKKPAANTKLPSEIRLIQGTINIQNTTTKSMQSYQNVQAGLMLPIGAKPTKIKGTATLREKPFAVDVFIDHQSGTMKSALSLTENASIEMEGNVHPDTHLWTGKVQGNIADIGAAAAFFTGNTYATDKPIPLSFTGNAVINDEYFLLNKTEALLDQQKSRVIAYVGWQKQLTLGFALDTASLDLQRMVHSLHESILPELTTTILTASSAYTPPDIAFIMNAEKVLVGQKEYQQLSLQAERDGDNLIVHHGSMHMPGETVLDVTGMVSRQPEGQRFSGSAKIVGGYLNQWLAHFEPYAENLPAEDFSTFSLEGNLFISAEQLRFSEARLNINDYELVGGFATYFEKMPRIEAEVKLKNANLDYFRNAWHNETNTNDHTYQLLSGNKSRFDWLKRLPAIMDFNIAIEGFRLLDDEGDMATMRLYVTPGEMSLYSIDARFPNNTLTGNLKFNVLGDMPKLDVVFTMNKFDTNYFATDKSSDTPWFDPENEKQRWSEELFDVRWMSTLDGSADISIGKLTHHGQDYPDFKWRADLKKSAMTIQKLTFGYLGGNFDLNGTFIGGKVPGLSASFAIYNGDLEMLLNEYLDISDITGRVSLTGVVSTSGIHMKSWAEQCDMKITAVGRGVRVKNLNLQSVVDTTSAARSTQDVSENVKNVVFDGVTELAVDGTLNFQQGIIKTPGVRLTSGLVLGNLTGEVHLLPWTMNLNTQWQFPELSSSTIPTMTISQQGAVNDYKTRIDTASLEAFVAKRIISQ